MAEALATRGYGYGIGLPDARLDFENWQTGMHTAEKNDSEFSSRLSEISKKSVVFLKQFSRTTRGYSDPFAKTVQPRVVIFLANKNPTPTIFSLVRKT